MIYVNKRSQERLTGGQLIAGVIAYLLIEIEIVIIGLAVITWI